jgi:hypothetical protein
MACKMRAAPNRHRLRDDSILDLCGAAKYWPYTIPPALIFLTILLPENKFRVSCGLRLFGMLRGCRGGVAQLGERLNGIQEVRGSIPLASTPDRACSSARPGFDQPFRLPARMEGHRGNSSVGRAQPCQGWGRGFESRFPLCFANRLQCRTTVLLPMRSRYGRLAQLVRAPR